MFCVCVAVVVPSRLWGLESWWLYYEILLNSEIQERKFLRQMGTSPCLRENCFFQRGGVCSWIWAIIFLSSRSTEVKRKVKQRGNIGSVLTWGWMYPGGVRSVPWLFFFFFCLWMSSCFSIVCLKVYLASCCGLLFFCQKSIDCIYVSLWAFYSVPMTYLSVFRVLYILSRFLSDCITPEEKTDSRFTVHLNTHCYERYLDAICHY